ncbi:uncharacterized protein DS421_17g593450 [Arachis hypogaea]|nr:uncharacterized protein DS421_17g593450 [Arachis hypogaea]
MKFNLYLWVMSLLAALLVKDLVFQMEHAKIAQCIFVMQICRMIVPPQHNLRINFHGFLVLCILLIVQKVVMGLTPAV